MTERPILFSAPMVRAILAGTKTQTRRVVKQQITPLADGSSWHQFDHRGSNYRMNLRNGTVSQWSPLLQFCPLGQPGDRLWVRETFVQGFPADPATGRLIQFDDDGNELPKTTWYRATDAHISWEDDDGWETNVPWKPSIHMPRWASRITLEITGVRVERLQDISEADAIAEGIAPAYDGWRDYRTSQAVNYPCAESAIHSYQTLWEQINGDGSWDVNPWVWVVEFKRLEGTAT